MYQGGCLNVAVSLAFDLPFCMPGVCQKFIVCNDAGRWTKVFCSLQVMPAS